MSIELQTERLHCADRDVPIRVVSSYDNSAEYSVCGAWGAFLLSALAVGVLGFKPLVFAGCLVFIVAVGFITYCLASRDLAQMIPENDLDELIRIVQIIRDEGFKIPELPLPTKRDFIAWAHQLNVQLSERRNEILHGAYAELRVSVEMARVKS